jgi:hypothetical protein
MTKQQAIDALDHLLHMVDKRDNKFDYYVWCNRAEIELEAVFGKKSTQLNQFKTFGTMDESLNTRLIRKRALIEEYKGHVYRHGPSIDNPITIDPQSVTRTEFFDAMKQIPGGRLWSIWWPTFAWVVGVVVAILGTVIPLAYFFGTLKVDSTALDFKNDNDRLTAEKNAISAKSRQFERAYHGLESKVKMMPDSVRKQYGLP